MSVETAAFGRLAGGEEVALFTLRNGRGMEARVAAYGGVLVSLRVPDRDGRMGDVVLGFDTLDGYVADTAFLGALIGRYANRIRAGRFTLDGREHTLPVNNGPNHLHGGPGGFHKVLWSAAPLLDGETGVALTHVSPDGDQGYPGTLTARVVYRLTDDDELVVEYGATTDAPTPVCLTQHTYFNLTGDPSRAITGHELTLEADRYTPVDDALIPTGEQVDVAGTPFDFRAPAAIGARIGEVKGGGYDHNFVLSGDGGLALAARVREPSTGRVLEVWTTEPGMQFYSGNYLDGLIRGKGGQAYGHRAGFCLEPQHFPDSPNQPSFPPVILRPGETLASRTVYRFGVD